jgi:hypothetical protein
MSERDPLDLVGTVTWPTGEVATLFLDGTWSMPALPAFESMLKDLYSDPYPGPEHGPFGVRGLSELAEDVGGVAWILPREGPDDPDIVY